MTALQFAIHFINSSLIIRPYVAVTTLSHTRLHRPTKINLYMMQGSLSNKTL